MKKFISIIAAVSMLLSLCAVNVNAATSAQPSLNIYAEPYDGTDAPANYKPGDYDVYKVWYTTAGVDTNEDMVVGLEIKFTIDDDSKIASKSWLASSKKTPKDANGVYDAFITPTLMSKGYYSWADPASGVDAYDWDAYDGGTEETLPYIETLIYVTAGETVTFTYGNSMLAVDSTAGDNYREFTSALAYNVNGTAGNVLTLGGTTTTYKYTFKTYDGNSEISSSDINAGDAVVAPTAPERAGFTFVGWATSAGGAAVTIDTTATADTTYYAVYSKDPVPVTSVSLDKSELTFKVGGAAQTLTATVDPSDADVKTVDWSTSDTSVAIVENGVVTPVGAGKATITVASTENSEKSASCVVKVNPADVASANFKEIANGTSLSDLTGKPVDASKNYGAGRINTDIDTGVFSYQVVATDDAENEKAWDLPSGLEVAGNINFIAIVKSATHVIKNIFLRGTVK